ncbi:MAG: GWxTD domain-containing protein [Bryobacteraceae bacterium]|jgi:GWxTD domain-containing protein
MNGLALWVHTPVAQAVGWALIHFLWEGAALAAVLAAALFLLRPASARARYAAACLILFAMPLAFAITLLVVLPGHAETVTAAHLPNPLARLSAVPAFQPAPAPRTFRDFLPWLAPCWFLGVAFFYARGLAAWLAARRLRQRGTCAPAPDWQDRLTQLCDRMRLLGPVRLLESCFTDAPVLVGYLRPVIFMPLGCLANLPAGQIECILIHELAHIRRHDYLVNLLQGFVEGLLFYHPAVWWASRMAREERENCCDDFVVEITGDARVYAATLAALEHRRAVALEAAVAATGGSLMKRIRRLLTEPQPAQASATPAFAAGLLLITFAAALAAWPAKPPARQIIPAVALQAPLLESQTIEPQSSPLTGALQESQIPQRQRTTFLGLMNPFAQSGTQTAPPAQRKGGDPTAQQALTTPYRKWLNEDVAYIITDEERAAFHRLQTDDEREHFIEQFWLRRDPTPGTPENEFREEHYRRIAYVNEHFSSRIPGWKTDRGRIYITYGPPDEIEDHSSGGSYQRPAVEGGGTTSTFPFQQWRYRFIEGIGTNVIIEFVDPTMSGEFHMTMDPSEKQALLAVKGLTPLEQTGITAARPAKTFRSDQDRRITIVTGGGSPSGNTASRLNTLVITPDPVAGRFHITAEVTTLGGQTVQVVAQNVLAEISGPFVEWLELPVGSYILRATITDPNLVSKSSETRFTVD